ncbi:uncharacterized protein LOC144908815 [Branchiostoma floridae x Branchiostoma belcheri]
MRCSMASPVAMVTALVVALLCCQAASFHAPHKGTARFRSNSPSADARDRTLRAVYSDWEGGSDEEEPPGEDDYYPDWPAASESDREPVWVEQKPGPAAASAKQQKPAKATASKATPAPQPPPGFPPPPGVPPPPGGPPPLGGPALPKVIWSSSYLLLCLLFQKSPELTFLLRGLRIVLPGLANKFMI